MKRYLIKIIGVFILIGFLVYLFYAPRLEFDVLENPNHNEERRYEKAKQPAQSTTAENPKLEKGLGLLVGESMTQVTKKYGQADRVYHYLQGYQTYVFKRDKAYMLITTKDNEVKSAYVTGKTTESESGPIKIGEDATNLYNNYSLNTEPQFDIGDKHYHFELSDKDVKTQALIQFNDIFAQVFIDQQSNKIMGVRYLDKQALVDMNPYSSNEMDDSFTMSHERSDKRNPDQNANQLLTLYELTNEMRELHHRDHLEVNSTLENVATVNLFQSVDDSSAEFTENNLMSLINETPLSYQSISQNVGYNFSDVPTLVNSWMNSDAHRSRLLSGKYDEMGGKIDDNYFLLIFLERGADQDDV
ncbi:CAP-associated domain-containing protein [Staphylococcus sp. IVB6238]|uniref:CAP-associated domain-containing protein n=1 Tax=unclassified Staphylococcus TaxID=91994 RepID=UPI0021D14792|nr:MULTISPECIES: CAP-associated domain-containing protein [unclassified Staphylococcus]UXR72291.1 CAP-associated domain-containing protein [Staphylococcus sp. IVB6240]UXR74598.1 CAP-associated domain-containing protein [Staphylococcus sp. IVB6238]